MFFCVSGFLCYIYIYVIYENFMNIICTFHIFMYGYGTDVFLILLEGKYILNYFGF